MSTFLVSFGVVAAAIAAVVYVVLNGPDQPATIRRQPSRDRPRRTRRVRPPAPAPAPVVETLASAPPRAAVGLPVAAAPAFAGPDSDIMRLRVLPARRTTLWVRIRSGVALVILVAILGALLALAVSAVVIGIAFVIRSATGA